MSCNTCLSQQLTGEASCLVIWAHHLLKQNRMRPLRLDSHAKTIEHSPASTSWNPSGAGRQNSNKSTHSMAKVTSMTFCLLNTNCRSPLPPCRVRSNEILNASDAFLRHTLTETHCRPRPQWHRCICRNHESAMSPGTAAG